MSVQTVLLDFTIDPLRIADELTRKDLMRLIRTGLEKYFVQLKFVFDVQTDDGYLCVFSDQNVTFINVRLFSHGLITLNVEYFKAEYAAARFSFDVSVGKGKKGAGEARVSFGGWAPWKWHCLVM